MLTIGHERCEDPQLAAGAENQARGQQVGVTKQPGQQNLVLGFETQSDVNKPEWRAARLDCGFTETFWYPQKQFETLKQAMKGKTICHLTSPYSTRDILLF